MKILFQSFGEYSPLTWDDEGGREIRWNGGRNSFREHTVRGWTFIFKTWHVHSGRVKSVDTRASKAFFGWRNQGFCRCRDVWSPEAARNGRSSPRGTGKWRRRVLARALSASVRNVWACTNTAGYRGSLTQRRTNQRRCLIVIPLELLDIPQSAHF